MKKMSVLTLIILLFLNACGPNEQKEHDQNNEKNMGVIDEEKVEQPSFIRELAETKTVDMLIEGMTEQKVVELHHHEHLGFSTYVPDDMVVDSDDQAFNVYTNFEDTKNEDARLFILKKTEKEVTDLFKEEGFNIAEVNDTTYEFSEKEFRLEKEGFSGRFSIFTQNDESYILGYYYPSEYGDGFSPRSQIIVDELVWYHK